MKASVWRVLALVGFLMLSMGPAMAVTVTQVYHEPQSFNPGQGERAVIHFLLDERADVTLCIYDGRDIRVRSVQSEGLLPPGSHRFEWDGKDSLGRPVPPEAYRYTLEARPPSGKAVVWDVSDLTGGEAVRGVELKWDPESLRLRYALPHAARIRVRIGLDGGGPLLRTLIDWVPRLSGEHEEVWDGQDAAGVLDLTRHPKLLLEPDAFTLSNNAILVDPPPTQVRVIEDLPEPLVRRESLQRSQRRMRDYARQSLEQRRDFPISASFPPELPRTAEGLPIVTQPVPLRLEVAPEHLGDLLAERFEAMFYVDGLFRFETEAGFFPLSWTWDPASVNPGPHYITVNLIGYDGHFGITTLRVQAEPPGSATDSGSQR